MKKSDLDSETQLREHSFDGIQEYDNQLPRWWVWSFWLSCIFGVLYLWSREISGTAEGLHEKYEKAFKVYQQDQFLRSKKEKYPDEPQLQEMMLAQANEYPATGKAIYDSKCASCHGTSGEGLVGPNLTDQFWIHGNQLNQIAQVIREGVPEKGMVPWKSLLTQNEILSVSFFIKSLEGQNLPGKSPEGNDFSATEE